MFMLIISLKVFTLALLLMSAIALMLTKCTAASIIFTGHIFILAQQAVIYPIISKDPLALFQFDFLLTVLLSGNGYMLFCIKALIMIY